MYNLYSKRKKELDADKRAAFAKKLGYDAERTDTLLKQRTKLAEKYW